jgi:predicted ester cyclase
LDLAEDTKNFGRPAGREGFRRVLEDILTTFPDYHYEIEEMVAEGDSVIIRCKVSGTHRGIGKRPVNGGM